MTLGVAKATSYSFSNWEIKIGIVVAVNSISGFSNK